MSTWLGCSRLATLLPLVVTCLIELDMVGQTLAFSISLSRQHHHRLQQLQQEQETDLDHTTTISTTRDQPETTILEHVTSRPTESNRKEVKHASATTHAHGGSSGIYRHASVPRYMFRLYEKYRKGDMAFGQKVDTVRHIQADIGWSRLCIL